MEPDSDDNKEVIAAAINAQPETSVLFPQKAGLPHTPVLGNLCLKVFGEGRSVLGSQIRSVKDLTFRGAALNQ